MAPNRWKDAFALSCLIVLASLPALGQLNPDAPSTTVKLVFIHHSTGENWLSDDNDNAGRLGLALMANNYFASDTNYGWGPNSVGDRTDIGNWWDWFRGPGSAEDMAALYSEWGQNCGYSRLGSDPGGENQLVMFKSCFPNSNLGGNPTDPIPSIDNNPLKGNDSGSEHHTIANAKGIYLDILNYFATRQDKLFVIICAPPLQEGDTSPEAAANARALNDWLVGEYLAGYPYHNVFAFDFYTVLTSNGGSPSTNDLGASTGNHHRWRNGQIEHVTGVANNFSSYPSGDSHPSSAGGQKATGEYLPLLNIAYNCWKGTGGCPGGGCNIQCGATVPPSGDWGIPVPFEASATTTGCTGSLTYDWDFGDGTPHAFTQDATHTYGTSAAFAWTLTARADSAVCTRTGTYGQAQPSDCSVQTTWTLPATAEAGTAVTFQVDATKSPSCTGGFEYEWDFGDGSPHETTPGVTHTWATAGTYPVSAETTLGWNTSNALTGQIEITSTSPPPSINSVWSQGGPFRVKLGGSDFAGGCQVFIGSDTTPWGNVTFRSPELLVLKGGKALKALFPIGTPVLLRVVNPDGGEATASFTRG